jgi:hypothetical protein
MNWDAIGAIAELLGAIGVIASLIYLATQIRQSREQMGENTRAARASGYQSFFQNMDEVAMRSTSSPEMAQSVRLGLTRFDQLTEEQAFYFNNWIIGMLLAFDNGHYQFGTGILEAARWRVQRGNLTNLLSAPGTRQWWSESPIKKDFLGPEFVALVEEILGEEPDRGDEVGHVSVGAS